VNNLKPSPDLYAITLETFGIKPVKAVAFETSKEGIEGAKAAGIFCVTLKGCPEGDYVLDSFMGKPILHMLEEIDLLKRKNYSIR
jgi:beta-phosphoglucomutase-like phosphatase (HAD superfamily)